MLFHDPVADRRAEGVDLDSAAHGLVVRQPRRRRQAVGLDGLQSGRPLPVLTRQPHDDRQRVAIDQRAGQGLKGQPEQGLGAGGVAFGRLCPGRKLVFGGVGPFGCSILIPAEHAVFRLRRQPELRADDIVVEGLLDASADGVVARQIARAAGNRRKLWQQVGIGRARRRHPGGKPRIVFASGDVRGHPITTWMGLREALPDARAVSALTCACQ